MSFSEFKNSSVRVFRVVVIGFDSAKKCTNQNKLIKKLKKKKKKLKYRRMWKGKCMDLRQCLAGWKCSSHCQSRASSSRRRSRALRLSPSSPWSAHLYFKNQLALTRTQTQTRRAFFNLKKPLRIWSSKQMLIYIYTE